MKKYTPRYNLLISKKNYGIDNFLPSLKFISSKRTFSKIISTRLPINFFRIQTVKKAFPINQEKTFLPKNERGGEV